MGLSFFSLVSIWNCFGGITWVELVYRFWNIPISPVALSDFPNWELASVLQDSSFNYIINISLILIPKKISFIQFYPVFMGIYHHNFHSFPKFLLLICLLFEKSIRE
jgi:hypothetical protein